MALKVPTYSQQQVSTAPLPSPSAQAVPSGLGALGAGIEAAGKDVAEVYFDKKAKDDQTVVFNGVASGRRTADAGVTAWGEMRGQPALDAAPQVLADFDAWMSETRAGMTPDQQRGFDMQIQSVRDDLSATLARETVQIRFNLANASLANVVQAFTESASRKAASGQLRLSETPSIPDAPAPPPGGTHGALGMVGGDPERDKILSAIGAHFATYGRVMFGSHEVVAQDEAERLAVSELHSSRINALLTPKPDVPVDYRTARAYFDRYKGEIDNEGPDARDKLQEDVSRAYQVGETARQTDDIWQRYANEAKPWREREEAMQAAAAKLPETYRADVAGNLKRQAEAVQKQEHETRAETHRSLKQALAQGVPLDRVVQSAEFGSLSPEPDLQDALIGYGNDVKAGKYVVTDPAEYDRLTSLATDDPDAFIATNFEASRDLSPTDAKALGEQAQKMRQDRERGDTLASGFIETSTVVNDAARALYGDKDSKADERGRFKRDLNDAVIAWQAATGKKATPEDVQQIADAYTAKRLFERPYRFLGLFETAGRTVEEARVSDVMPPDVLDDAVFALKQAGLEVNADNLAEFWRQFNAGR